MYFEFIQRILYNVTHYGTLLINLCHLILYFLLTFNDSQYVIGIGCDSVKPHSYKLKPYTDQLIFIESAHLLPLK